MKRLLLSFALVAGIFSAVSAQQLLASFQNTVVSGNTISFDIFLEPGSGYNAATSISNGSASLRFNISGAIQPTAGNVITSQVFPGFSASGQASFMGGDVAGSAKFAVLIVGGGPDPFLSATVPIKICRVSITCPAIPLGAVVTMRPSTAGSDAAANGGSGFSYNGGSNGAIIAQNNISLAVRMMAFNAHKSGDQANLDWITLTENQSKGFEVERSRDGKTFEEIAFVKTQAIDGNSTSEIKYDFADAAPLSGVNYYRLKHTNTSGKVTYSNTHKLIFDIAASLSIAPNPFKDRIEIGGLMSGQDILFTDMSGKVIMTKTATTANEVISTAGVANGIYILTVSDKGKVVNTAKIVKQ